MFRGKCIVLGVTGSIAAYKSADLTSRLKKRNADVTVVMTRNALEFITPQTMETMSKNPVVHELFARPEKWEVEHISLARRADLFVIAPATANIIAKLANGIADDFLSTTAMATRAPILIAPAMNDGMWTHDATQENVETLKKRGVHFIGPGSGFLAEGYSAVGRMIENEAIIDAIAAILIGERDLIGKKILVTAGPTREPVDPVRYISNRSSGRMGIAIAQAARDRGAQVTLLLGTTGEAPPAGVDLLRFETTIGLYRLATDLAPDFDAVIQAAAPGDYRAEQVADQKIKKDDEGAMQLRLVQNPDVAAALGDQKRAGQVLVAFAAETENLIENARKKLAKKNADIVVANDVSKEGAGFEVATNIASLVTAQAVEDLPIMDKRKLADRILDAVVRFF